MRRWLPLLLAACAPAGGAVDQDDPCLGEVLPACPGACPEGFAATCGEPCDPEGASCGNTAGEGRVCTDGRWLCPDAPPLPGPNGCDRVCDP